MIEVGFPSLIDEKTLQIANKVPEGLKTCGKDCSSH